MSETGVIILIIANIPVYLLFGWALFDSWGNFFSKLFMGMRRKTFRSQITGEHVENSQARLNIIYYLISCACVVYAEYKFITWFFGD